MNRRLRKDNYNHADSIVMTVCTSLTFFWRLHKFSKNSLVEIFSLKFENRNLVVDAEGGLQNSLHRLLKNPTMVQQIGTRPVYASVDTKDQTIRLRILPKDAESTMLNFQFDWFSAKGQPALGVIKRFTDVCKLNNWNIRQLDSRESAVNHGVKGRTNLTVDLGILAIVDECVNHNKDWINEYFKSCNSDTFKINRHRITRLTHLQSLSLRRRHQGNSSHRVKFAISSPGELERDAKECEKKIKELGYYAEYIERQLKKADTKESNLHRMADVVRDADILIVLVDKHYGKIKLNPSKKENPKRGFYSELEVAMAYGANLEVVFISFNQKRPIQLPSEAIISVAETIEVVDTKTNEGLFSFAELLEEIYFKASDKLVEDL